MKKANAIGLAAIENFLNERAKPGAWDNSRFQALVEVAREGEVDLIEIDPADSVSGEKESFRLPIDGFDLVMTLQQFGAYADAVKWTSVQRVTLDATKTTIGRDDNGNSIIAAQWNNNVWRDTTVTHDSGKIIKISFNEDQTAALTAPEHVHDDESTDIPHNHSTTLTVIGVVLVSADGTLEPYQTICDWFDARKGKFGTRANNNCVDMKTIDRRLFVPPPMKDGEIHESLDDDDEDDEDEDGNAPQVEVVLEGQELEFSITLIAEATSEKADLPQWETLRLKQSWDEKYFCEHAWVMSNGDVRMHGTICASEDDVISFYGDGPLAHEIYTQAGIKK